MNTETNAEPAVCESTLIVDKEVIRLGGLTKEAFILEMQGHQPSTVALLCHRLAVSPGEGSVLRLWETCKRLAHHYLSRMHQELAA